MAKNPPYHIPPLSADQIASATLSIQGGLSRRKALRKAGVSPSDYKRIEELASGGIQPYQSFLQGLDAAEAELEEGLIKVLIESKDWRAAESVLKRRFAAEWGDKIQLEVQREVDHILDLAEKTLLPEQYAVLVAALAGSGQGADDSPPEPGGTHSSLPN